MARTPSTMLELGTRAPEFNLPDTSGKMVASADLTGGAGMLVVFICNHCPYVIYMQSAFVELASEYRSKNINIAAISSNDVENYPDDSPEKMAQRAAELGFSFPYLYDESQEVARAYKAACTPDIFLFDGQQNLYYRGQFDSSRPSNQLAPTGSDLRSALDNLIQGNPPPENQIPSLGCNIKWKPGNEPDYFG